MMVRLLGWVFWHVRLPGRLAPIWFNWYISALARAEEHHGKITRTRVTEPRGP